MSKKQQGSVKSATKHLRKGYKLLRRAENQIKRASLPELDVSLALGLDKASYYGSIIKVMR